MTYDLLVDIGNTRLKWALASQGAVQSGMPVANHALNDAQLAVVWSDIPVPRQLIIACVGAHRLKEVVKNTARKIWPNIGLVEAVSQAHGMGVTNAYLEPQKLGVDRWLALLAARHYHRLPACIVDCGSAITIDLIDDEGNHLGGFISPGLNLMQNALFSGTVALGCAVADNNIGPATSTGAAIYSGVILSACGLIEHIQSSQNPNYSLLLTGGDAEIISSQLFCPYRIDPDLVLRGLALLGDSST